MTEEQPKTPDEVALKVKLQELLERESERIQEEAVPERAWWSNKIIEDQYSPFLVKLQDEFDSFKLIRLLRTGKEPRVARQESLNLLKEIDQRWKARLDEKGVPHDDVLLAITSAYRTRELQDQLIATSGLAARGYSAHCAGAAVDFDPNGYYVKQGDDRKAVCSRTESYNPQFTSTLREVVLELQQEGSCHLVLEKGYRIKNTEVEEYEACYHVAVAPDFKIS
jgi:hypothetical protein